jgi:hypothetical protein
MGRVHRASGLRESAPGCRRCGTSQSHPARDRSNKLTVGRRAAARHTENMAIQKQEFYEGAALHQLIRGAGDVRVRYAAPLFVLDERLQVHLKYSTVVRSPWGFTSNPDEQRLLVRRASELPLVIGLVCGADGVAVVSFEHYSVIARPRTAAIRVACFRKHREHFEVSGPDGTVPGKVPPSDWHRLLNN